MGFHIDKYVEWQAGAGTPVKYSVHFDLDCTLTSQTNTQANFDLVGRVTVTNNPENSRNSWPASDFAVLMIGDKDPADYGWTAGQSYYKAALPMLPNAPQSYVEAVRVEFRGDTSRADGPNAVSLWTAGGGLLINTATGQGSYGVNINQKFTLALDGTPTQPVLTYITSGANSSTDYNWQNLQVWAELINFDYRPGQIWSGTEWLSHNRANGTRRLWTRTGWQELRTANGPSGSNEPPCIWDGSRQQNMRRIGAQG